MTQSGAVSEAYCPDSRCTPQVGMRKTTTTQKLEPVARGRRSSGVSLWEERPSFYRRKRRRREGSDGRRNKETEAKRTASSRRAAPFAFELHFRKNLFSFRVTFRIPVVRGKNLDIGSAHSRNPWRIVTRRGEADGGGGARVDIPLVLMLVQVGKEPPL